MAKRKQTAVINYDDLDEQIDKAVNDLTAVAGDRLRDTIPAWLGRVEDTVWDAGELRAYVRLKQEGESTLASYPPDAPVQLFEFDLPILVKKRQGSYEIVGLNPKEGAQFFEGQLPLNAMTNLPLAMTQDINGFKNAAVIDTATVKSPLARRQYQLTSRQSITPGAYTSLGTTGEGQFGVDANTLKPGDEIIISMAGQYLSPVAVNSVIVTIEVDIAGGGGYSRAFPSIPTSTVSQQFTAEYRLMIVDTTGYFIVQQSIVSPVASPTIQLKSIYRSSDTPLALDFDDDVSFQFKVDFLTPNAGNTFTLEYCKIGVEH